MQTANSCPLTNVPVDIFKLLVPWMIQAKIIKPKDSVQWSMEQDPPPSEHKMYVGQNNNREMTRIEPKQISQSFDCVTPDAAHSHSLQAK